MKETYPIIVPMIQFQTPDPIPMNVISLIPAIALGIFGGVLGALFTRLNSLIVEARKNIIGLIPHPTAQKFARVLECVLICVSTNLCIIDMKFTIFSSPFDDSDIEG